MEARCSCISNAQRMCPTTIVLQLNLKIVGQEDLVINDYTSTWFVMNRLALHVRASHLSQDMEDNILDITQKVLSYINDRDGFCIIGWAKCGMIQDQGSSVQQDNQGHQRYMQPANQGSNNMVKNAEVQYHIVMIHPSNPENIDLDKLNAFKYDMNHV
jgi:hypothetical protein